MCTATSRSLTSAFVIAAALASGCSDGEIPRHDYVPYAVQIVHSRFTTDTNEMNGKHLYVDVHQGRSGNADAGAVTIDSVPAVRYQRPEDSSKTFYRMDDTLALRFDGGIRTVTVAGAGEVPPVTVRVPSPSGETRIIEPIAGAGVSQTKGFWVRWTPHDRTIGAVSVWANDTVRQSGHRNFVEHLSSDTGALFIPPGELKRLAIGPLRVQVIRENRVTAEPSRRMPFEAIMFSAHTVSVELQR
jgi:hypothetical protein